MSDTTTIDDAPPVPEGEPAPPSTDPPRGLRKLTSRVTGAWPFFPIFVLFGLNAVDELDRTAFAILIPEVRDHFNLDNEGILAVEALVGLAVLLFAVPVGQYADRGNRVRIAGIGAGVWGLFSVFTGLAPTLVFLGIARSGAGFGRAVVEPTHNSLIADYYPIDQRTPVYSFHRGANYLGRLLGPLLGGGIAYALGWRAPFVLFAIPTAIFVLLTLRMKEPRRGVFEREAAGASDEDARTAEVPPSFTEAQRILWQVRTLRRIWFSLPFFAASLIGLGSLLSLYYEDVFGLNEVERGFTFAATEGTAILGLLLGTPYVTRLAIRDPSSVCKFLGYVSCVIALAFVPLAMAPSLPIAIGVHALISAGGAVLVPGVYAVLSLAMPPKVRSLGFALGSLWVLPGLLALPIIGAISDNIGIRKGILLAIPLYFLGAIIISTSGRFMNRDIKRVWTSAATQAEVRAARLAGDAKILVVRDVEVSYGQTQVLFGVDMDVRDGEVIALLGTNGAGKSTLLKAISGSVEPHNGAIIFDGRDITMLPPSEAAALGLVIVPGGKGVFPTLTVSENMELAGWLLGKSSKETQRAMDEAIDTFPILRERWTQKAGNLSGGEQQMLTIAQALIAKPKLLMIDELSLGLAPKIVEQLLEVVRSVAAQGVTIILVEQSVNVALTLAERAVFMEKGEIRFDGPTADLLHRPDVLRSVFLEGAAAAVDVETEGLAGHDVKVVERELYQLPHDRRGRPLPPLLSTRDLSVSFGGIMAVNGVDLDVYDGQIVGLIGPNGAGKTTIFDLVCGLLPATRGRVILAGKDISELPADARGRRGIGRSFQDARLFPSMTVRETIAVAFERHLRVKDPLAAVFASPATKAVEKEVNEKVDKLIEMMRLSAFANKFVFELSTGSRRIVDLACTVAHDPTVLLLDEPSSGIAQRETEALGPLLLDIRDQTGAALLVIEHDMPLITDVSDHMVALELGQIMTQGTPEDVVNDPRVVASYLGTTEETIHRSGDLHRAMTHEQDIAPSGGNGSTNGGGNGRRRREPLTATRTGPSNGDRTGGGS